MSILKDFRAFVTRGNVVDLAVGFIVGAAFGNIVSSLVKDVIMPPIGLALGAVDFKDLAVTLKAAQGDKPAVMLSYGQFVNTIVSFLIVAFSVFMLISVMHKITTRLEKPKPGAAATTKECPECMMAIPVNAKRCGHCTTSLK